MTLYELIKRIKGLYELVPNAGTIEENENVYVFNHKQDVLYPCFCTTVEDVEQNVMEEYTEYHLYLFTFDRLTDDKSNKTDIQSHSISILKAIVATLEREGGIIQNVIYRTFEERLNDVCAGGYADLTIRYEDICDVDLLPIE